MADRRRRRRNTSTSDSDHSEDESVPSLNSSVRGPRDSECESEIGTEKETEQSEYESATEDNEDEDETEAEEETETEYDDSVIVEEENEEWMEERQSGDGEETPEKSNLDDDEDRKNPAYIPRKGAFYEHDLRSGDTDAVKEEEKKPKKKLWQDEGKWDHDKFQPHLQAPKSREELIAEYGFDIRAHDKAPEAPPRRGGGRGRRGRPRLGDYIDKHGAGEGYPEDMRERPRKNYSDLRDGDRRPDNRNLPKNQGNYRDRGYNDSYQGNQQRPQKEYNRNFNRDFPELSSDRYGPKENRNYENNERSRDNRHAYDRRQDYQQPPRGYDNDYQRGGDFIPRGRGGGPGPRRGAPRGPDQGGRGGSRGRGGPIRGGRGGGPRPHDGQRPFEDQPRSEPPPHKGREGNLLPPPPPPTIMAREFTNSNYKGGPPPGFQVRDNRTPPHTGERTAEQKRAIEIVKDISPEPPPVTTITSSTSSGVKFVSSGTGGTDESITPPILKQPSQERKSNHQDRRGGRGGGSRGGGRGGYTQRVEQAMQGMHISDQGPPSHQAAPNQKQSIPQQQGPRHPPPGYMGTKPQQIPSAHGPPVHQNVPSGQPVRGMSPAMIQQQQQQQKGGDRSAGTKRYSSQRQRAAPESGYQEQPTQQPRQQAQQQNVRMDAAGAPPFYPSNYNVPPRGQGGHTRQTPPGPPPGLFRPQQDPPVANLNQQVRGMMQAPVGYPLPNVPSSHMGQQIFNPPAATMPTATAAAAQQAIIQPAAYIATPVLNYPAGPHAAAVQLTTAAPSATHYQIAAAPTGHVPIAQATPVVMAAAPQSGAVAIPTSPQTETPGQGAPGVEVKGGTTYFSPEMQKPAGSSEPGPGIQVKGGTTYFSPEFQQGPGRATGKRPKAAIPIVSPTVSGGGEQEFDSVEMDESQEQGRSQFNVMSTEFYPAQQFQQEPSEGDSAGDENPTSEQEMDDYQTQQMDTANITGSSSQENQAEEFHNANQGLSSEEVVSRESPSGGDEFEDAETNQSENLNFVNQSQHSEETNQDQETSLEKQTESEGVHLESHQSEPQDITTVSQSYPRNPVPDLHNQEAISDNVTNEIIETVTTCVRNIVTTTTSENEQVQHMDTVQSHEEVPSDNATTNTLSADGDEVSKSDEDVSENKEPSSSNHQQIEQPVEHNVQVCFEREVKIVETQPKIENDATADSSQS